jgi:hypothetical protein
MTSPVCRHRLQQLDHWQAFRRPANESSGIGGLDFIGLAEDDRLKDFVATIDKWIAKRGLLSGGMEYDHAEEPGDAVVLELRRHHG